MRRILTFLFLLAFVASNINSQTYYKSVDYAEDFEELILGDEWGFKNQIPPAVINNGKAPNTSKVLQWEMVGQSGSRTGHKDFPQIDLPADGVLMLDFEWHLGVPTNRNTSGIFFRFLDSSGNISIAFSTASNNGSDGNAFHFVNLDNSVTTDATSTSTLVVPDGGNFVRDSWVKVHAALNFDTKVVDTLIVTNGTAVYEALNTPFYSNQASSLSRFEVHANRDGSNMDWTGQLDNFEIYHYEEVAALANVTVKFKDQDGNYFKADEIVANFPVGTEYVATALHTASYNDGTNFYVLNPASSISVPAVDESGSTLELLFRRSVKYPSLTWMGSLDENGNIWSEWLENFSNNSEALGSQSDADHIFDNNGVEKDVIINDLLNIGSGSIVISADGYSITGNGNLVGTGGITVDLEAAESLTFGVTNSLSGITEISGGSVLLTKLGALGTGVTVSNDAKIISGVNQTIPQMLFEESGTFDGGSFANDISGLSALSGSKVTILSSHDTNNDYGVGINPIGTLENGVELELNGLGAVENKFGLKGATVGYLANTKVSLKGNSMLYVDANQGGETTMNIGTLTGESSSLLGWGRSSALDRHITWSIGALNEDSEYAGSITNTGGYKGSGVMYVGDMTNIAKVGSGVLTLSGNSTNHNGNFTVNDGILNVTGAIANSTSQVVVNEDGTLTGDGQVGGTATINGVLDQTDGFLTLNNVVLAGILNIKADENNYVTIDGTLVQGGVLNVNIAQDPSEAASIKLIDVTDTDISGEFTTVNLPSEDYSLSVKSDGVYIEYTQISTAITNQLLEVKSVQYFDVVGNQVSENSYGILIKKITFVDGSTKVEKIVKF